VDLGMCPYYTDDWAVCMNDVRPWLAGRGHNIVIDDEECRIYIGSRHFENEDGRATPADFIRAALAVLEAEREAD